MSADFSKQIQGVLKSIRSTINPEYAIPEDQKDDPVNVRIIRLKETVKNLRAKMVDVNDELEKIETNLNGLIEELLDTQEKSEDFSESSEQSGTASSVNVVDQTVSKQTQASDSGSKKDTQSAEDMDHKEINTSSDSHIDQEEDQKKLASEDTAGKSAVSSQEHAKDKPIGGTPEGQTQNKKKGSGTGKKG